MDSKKELKFGITIKTEPGTSESTASQRLPSLRPPRDLSLSAFGQRLPPNLLGNQSKSKKVYVPNLNVQRNKIAEEASKIEQQKQKAKERDRKPEDKGRGRGRKNNLIQMGSSPFAEGLAQASKSQFSRSSGGGGGGEGGKGEVLQKPRLKLQENIKINKEEEEATMKALLRDDFVDDPGLEPDYDNCPVKLPLVDWKFFNVDEDKKVKVKENFADGIKVKTEPGLLEDSKCDDKKPLSIPDIIKSSSKEPQYIFLQLPNCMPGLKPEVETPNPKHVPSTSTTTTTSETETKADENRCLLSSLSPGCIGKLQILKSGRARLLLGDCKLSVQLGTQVAFKQDLISVNLDSSTYTGDMINMGHVTTRMIVSPDWEDMLLQQMHI